MGGGFYELEPIEAAWGYLPGLVGVLPEPTDDHGAPRAILERLVKTALERPPCGVAFSGGRDSSLVLAIAVHVARRDGLPDPIPITRVFPDVDDSDETSWQELVIRHLGVQEWSRLILHDEVDILGPAAKEHLLRHGLVWPPALVASIPLYDGLGGGTLIDGEGGDEILGIDTHRVAWLASLRLYPRPFRWWRVKAAAGSAAPARLRKPRIRDRLHADHRSWLRPDTQRALDDELIRNILQMPLSYADSVRQIPMRRSQYLANEGRAEHARAHGIELDSPLLHPDFVHAMARLGGFLGPGDRTKVLRTLAADLLPDEVLSRLSKASFNAAYIGRHSTEFAQSWTGNGVDDDLVDADALRETWLSARPPATSASLLQQAWLASAT